MYSILKTAFITQRLIDRAGSSVVLKTRAFKVSKKKNFKPEIANVSKKTT